MSDERKVKFWGSPDEERLSHTDINDAIESILDDPEPLPDTITVCGYYPSELPPVGDIAREILDYLLEVYGKDYGDPEGSVYDEGTPEMEKAAYAFAVVFRKEYSVWACKIVEERKINVMEWAKENRPDWIEDAKNE